MYLCSITPVKQVKWMCEQPMMMCLTHLVEKYPEYAAAVAESKAYKILDNSLVELGGAVEIDRVLAAADKIHADEIVLVDVYKDGHATVETVKKSIQWLREHNYLGKYKLQAVAHGSTKEDFIYCFNALNAMPEVDVIAIPKVTVSYEWCGGRSRAGAYHIFKNTDKEIHFLGSWYNLAELFELPGEVWDKVRSCDTCLPSLYVIQNKHVWEDREGTIDLEKDYPEMTKEKYDAVMAEMEQQVIKHQLHLG